MVRAPVGRAGVGLLPSGAGRPTMATITEWPLASETGAEGLAFAREVLRIEAEALERVRDRLGEAIARAAELIYRSSGSVIVTRMGKAGLARPNTAAA